MNINVEMTVEEFNDYQEYLKNGKKYVSLEDFLLLKGFKKDEEYTKKSYTPNHLVYVTKFKCENAVITIETDKFVDPFGLKEGS